MVLLVSLQAAQDHGTIVMMDGFNIGITTTFVSSQRVSSHQVYIVQNTKCHYENNHKTLDSKGLTKEIRIRNAMGNPVQVGAPTGLVDTASVAAVSAVHASGTSSL